MELVNQTAVPADAVLTTGVPADGPRMGMLVAKATFNLTPSGAVLETQDPMPLLAEDEPTSLGLLPADLRPRPGFEFEVLLLGEAHAPHGVPAPAVTVALTVGSVSHRLAVFGDRWWSDDRITPPQDFVTMPLTFDRAFGGRCDVWLDEHTPVEVRDPLNPLGLGFDAVAAGKQIAEAIGAADGFPRLSYTRQLPNVEAFENLIRSPQDAPEPACWAPAPADVPFSQIRVIRSSQAADEPIDADVPGTPFFLRSHPDWEMPIPEAGALVTLDGCTPGGRLSFELPRLRVIADYVLGDRSGSRELAPQILTLLPGERRVCIAYRSHYTAAVDDTMERSFRLRLEEGWYAPRGSIAEEVT